MDDGALEDAPPSIATDFDGLELPAIEPGSEPAGGEEAWPSSLMVRAPFPWFGGKSRVAWPVWRAFGPESPNYVEPFAGSLAMLLARPGGPGKIETVNDRDRYLANFWRAVVADPYAVALAADWPINEADLHARHRWLVNQAEFRERMHREPEYFDVKIAGWWVWGLCQWIGGGWCVEPKGEPSQKMPKCDGIGKGVHCAEGFADERKRPSLDGTAEGRGIFSEQAAAGALRGAPRPNLGGNQGVHAAAGWNARPDLTRRPDLTNDHGVHLAAQRPMLRVTDNASGQGIHASGLHAGLPALGNDRGLNGVSAVPCVEWFELLQRRLRRVRVACGDWRRVLGDSVLGKGKNVGGRKPCCVFLDPPYSHELRDPYLYSEDDSAISAQVRDWAIEHGDDPDLRIALCGYKGEHEMPDGWTEFAWKGTRGYAGTSNNNRDLERIWFSRHCLPLTPKQGSLFA